MPLSKLARDRVQIGEPETEPRTGLGPDAGTDAVVRIDDMDPSADWKAGAERMAFENVSSGIMLVDAGGKIVLANKAAERIFGYAAGRLVGRDVEELLPDPFRVAHRGHRNASLTDPVTRPMGVGLKLFGHRSDGAEFPVEVGFATVEVPDGVFVAAAVTDITERTLADARVAFQSSILEQAPNVVIALDKDYRITFWNDGASRIFGWAADEVLGRVATDLLMLHPEPAAEEPRRTNEVGGFEGDLHCTRRDGSKVWVHSVTASVADELGTAIGFVTLAVDISDRIRAEETLRDSEERFRAVVEAAPNGILMVNADGSIAMANRAVAEMLGYEPSDLVGSPVERLIPDHFQQSHVDHRRGYMTDPRTRPMGVDLDLFARRADGVEIPVEIGLSSVKTREGTLVAAVITDITDRKRAEQELERSAARLGGLHRIDLALLGAESSKQIAEIGLSGLRDLVSCARAAVTRFDTDAGVAVNLAVSSDARSRQDAGTVIPLTAFGDLESLREGTPNVVIDLAEQRSLPDAVTELLSEGVRSRVNLPLVAQGELIGSLDLGFAHTGAIDDEGLEIAREVASELAVMLQQAGLREELARRAAQLEKRVAERTADLADRNAELDSFAYSVSHDLRAPLRAMQGFAQALEEDYGPQLDDVAVDYTRRVTAAARHMDRLIQDLLEYSRLSRSELRVQPVDVRSALDEALESQVSELEERRAQVHVQGASKKVFGHPVTLVQVLSNLIGNAVKFVEPGTVPEVTILVEDRGSWVRIAVRDNGIGIAPEHQERIFRMLERLHGQESYPGTGIGLAIVRKGVSRMKGRTGVESVPGSGSTFWIELARTAGDE
jgi:PAS domain S-box-containing protein